MPPFQLEDEPKNTSTPIFGSIFSIIITIPVFYENFKQTSNYMIECNNLVTTYVFKKWQ